jgi:hypothetical protein
MLKGKSELECELSVDLEEATTAGKALHSAICSPKDLASAHGGSQWRWRQKLLMSRASLSRFIMLRSLTEQRRREEQERQQWEEHQERQQEEQERQQREQDMMGCSLPEI